jgi:hypothetical protein
LSKAATLQSRAFVNLFKSSSRVEEIGSVVSRLQNGDIKLRVRALEAERALNRMSIVQVRPKQESTIGNSNPPMGTAIH